ncbi:hypothetical protein PISL3812_03681 [Talaromyces islandicus]|uniref:Serine hydrolase domain-containing protein n=1 Tax=Talaromyces islandicus TaxID=28573 RepID=A0A0U1LVI1_TALIS|nr:hypothetical protein PISL3812_03681 [Talaromyces islandicus]
MKVLALHGVGSSSAVLKEQLAPLVSQLGPGYQFTFIDGAISCDRGPGIPKWFQGPFYTYARGFSPTEISEALEQLNAFIEENGPFDGVLGFSLGGSIAATYTLDRQKKYPGLSSPFRFAVFISSVGPFASDPSCLHGVVKNLVERSPEAFRANFPLYDFGVIEPRERVFAEYLALYYLVFKELGIMRPAIDLRFFQTLNTDDVPRLLHPLMEKDRIGIPTVHSMGKKENIRLSYLSTVVQDLCDKSLARTHQHQGGHTLPSGKDELQELASSIDWAAKRGMSLTGHEQAVLKL